eukprot:gene2142-5172_t
MNRARDVGGATNSVSSRKPGPTDKTLFCAERAPVRFNKWECVVVAGRNLPVDTLRVRPAPSLLTEGAYHGFCPICKAKIVFRSGGDTTDTLAFTLNGKAQTVSKPDPNMSLNEYIRTVAGLKGTKLSCGEGGCGACVVAITSKDPVTGKDVTVPVNSCLRLLIACDGLEITTVEGIGSTRKGLHPVQKTLANFWGSQCGGCSPGMANPKPTKQDVENCLDGNICRCTGYRPILAAFQSFAVDREGACTTDIEDMSNVYHTACNQLPCGKACLETRICEDKPARLKISLRDVTWIEPTNLEDLLEIVEANKSKEYMLVFGNTSTGVFKDQNPSVKIDVSRISELKTISADQDGTLHIGAGVSISQLISFLLKQAPISDSFTALAKHLQKVASTPIRAVASWAGNLMMAHDNPDFPSDIFTIMAGAKSLLNINSKSSGAKSVNLFEFLQMDMKGWVITKLTIPALKQNEHFTTHKKLLTSTPTMVFGGFSPHAVLSSTTAQFLNGKKLTASVIQSACNMLMKEFSPDQPPAAASAAYRQSLLATLFYKSILSSLPSIDPKVASAASPFIRPTSSGKQSYDTDPSLYPVSQPYPKMSAFAQTTGEAKYTDDAFIQTDSLFAAFVHADHGNCILQSIDTSAALQYPGVVDVITADELPITSPLHPDPKENQEPCLVKVGNRILFNGQSFAVVLAATQSIANAAAKLVSATYSDQQPVITSLEEAIETKSFFTNAHVVPLRKGKPINEALAECDTVVKGEISCGSQYHFHMETQTALAFPTDDGGLELHASTQNVTDTQTFASIATGIPASKIKVVMKRAGGSYGGKITRSWFTAAVVSFAANKHNVPVRTALELHSNMRLIGKRFPTDFLHRYNVHRHPWKCEYTIGTLNSRLHAVDMQWYADAGAYVFDSDGAMMQGSTACDAAYFCPNWQVVPTVCQTNTPSNTATRAPGCLPAVFIMETAMDHTAQVLGVDPVSFRYNNIYQEGQVTPTGMTLKYCSLSHLWSQFVDAIGYETRMKDVLAYNKKNMWSKRGLTIAPNKYGLGVGGFYRISAYVLVNGADGTVAVSCGGSEIGQGLDTKLAQVVAQQFGIGLDLVTVHSNISLLHSNSTPTGGSCTSDAVSLAAMDACTQINAVLQPIRDKNPGASWDKIVSLAQAEGLDIGARGWCSRPAPPGGFEYNSYGMVANEVQVDILTGEVQILRTDILFDCGQSLNPAIDIGQVEGGYVMGLGYFLSEEIIYDQPSGRLVTDGTWEYKPPSSKDIPIDLRVDLLKNAPNPVGVLRSKASGEPPTCMASSIVFSIKQAVESSLKDRDLLQSYVVANAPLTPEAVQQLCKVDPSQFIV